MKKRNAILISLLSLIAIFALTACGSGLEQSPAGESSSTDKLKVVATTTIVGDVVSQVGGEYINLSILLPVGTDPHSFVPTPQDIARVSEADLIFANGAGLEEFLDPLIESANAENRVVHVSDGIEFLVFEGENEADHSEEEHHKGVDPHTWTDPNNVIIWVQNIQRDLSKADPDKADFYAANAKSYLGKLASLETWMRAEIARVAPENRKLVTDHALFGYFADEYGFTQVGALIPGYSTLTEPTAQELAAIEDAIRELEVKAIFVGNTINPALAERVAADTGTRLVFVSTGSLSGLQGETPTYLDYMRYNTSAFVDALK